MISRRAIPCVLFCFLACASSGCALLGVAANAMPRNVEAKYSGLKGQTVGIIVWADRGIMIDWGPLQLDLANAVKNKLLAAKTDETKGMTFPYEPKSYVRYLRDHPGTESMPITEIGPKFSGITRLIYIEVQQFRTRSQRQLELFRGDATATLQIIEIDPTGQAKVAFKDDGIHAVYPRTAPIDGLPNLGDDKTYIGEVDALATQIVNRLVTHEEEEDRK